MYQLEIVSFNNFFYITNDSKLFHIFTGPRVPNFFVKNTPEKVTSSPSSSELFPEDKSSIAESSSEDTTEDNVTSNKRKKFTFRKFTKRSKQEDSSPTSSPLDWPEQIIISSDKELERSMVKMEQQVSLEMTSESD